jgi:hypothetical protein
VNFTGTRTNKRRMDGDRLYRQTDRLLYRYYICINPWVCLCLQELYRRRDKLEGIIKTANHTNEISQSLSANTKALTAQQEKKSWWKM